MSAENHYEITPRMAHIAEGYANGLYGHSLAQALYIDPETIYSHTRRLYDALEITKKFGNIQARAVSMFVAADLLQPSDMCAPGEVFSITMRPRSETPIQYEYMDYRTNDTFRMPKKGKPLGLQVFSAQQRTLLGCAALGMSRKCVVEAGLVNNIEDYKNRMVDICNQLGAFTVPHAVALSAFADIITIPHQILNRGEKVSPIAYGTDKEVMIDRPAYKIRKRRAARLNR